MAILLRGKTECGICHRIIGKDDAAVSFPAFVGNELDQLVMFNDASFHAACFKIHPMAKSAQERYETAQRLVGDKVCQQCSRAITNPDDYFVFDHFAPEDGDRLSKVSRQQFHDSCLSRWADLQVVLELLVGLKQSGKWRGRSIDYMIAVLQSVKS